MSMQANNSAEAMKNYDAYDWGGQTMQATLAVAGAAGLVTKLSGIGRAASAVEGSASKVPAAVESSSGKTFLPDEFYSKNLPKQVEPGTKSLPKFDEAGNLKQTKNYDQYGREKGWVDYTDHGYPLDHSVPHWHEVKWSAQHPDGIKFNYRFDTNPPFER